MTTTPAGTAPWTRTVSIADYGGDAQKSDYLGIGVINPKTDVAASQFLRLVSDLSSCVRTLPLCTLTITGRGGALHPLVTSVLGMAWNYDGAGYSGDSPPAGYPSVTGTSTAWTITFAAAYSDEFGVSGAIALRGIAAASNTAGAYANGTVSSDTVAAVIVSAATDSATIEIW